MQAPHAEWVQIKILITYQEAQTNRLWRQARVKPRKTEQKRQNHKEHREQTDEEETHQSVRKVNKDQKESGRRSQWKAEVTHQEEPENIK